MEEKLIEALNSITWYNGLAEIVMGWKGIESVPPAGYGGRDAEESAQLQILWMICVELFGTFGSSPRYGWIQDRAAFCDFIDRITATYQEHPAEEE